MGMSEIQAELLQKQVDKAMKAEQADTDAHCITLFSLALSIKAKHILELGVRKGNTTEALVLAASFTGGYVHSVDRERMNWKCPEGLEKHHMFVCQDSIEYLSLSERFSSVPLDLVFVDDWHAYAHVAREIALLSRITTKGSLICLHDTMVNRREDYSVRDERFWEREEWLDGGPWRAIDALDPYEWERATVPVNHGLTILRKIA